MDPQTMDEKFAEALRLARQASGLSQADVAAQMRSYGYEMSQPVIGKIERGERRVSIGEGEALAGILKQSTRTLLEGPTAWRIDNGVQFLRDRTAALRDAIERYESAQQVLAMTLDFDKRSHLHPASRADIWLAESMLEESPRDVLEAYEKDTQAAMAAHRLRDELDEEAAAAEDDDSRTDLDLTEENMSHLWRLTQARGDRMNRLLSAVGFSEANAAMRGTVLEQPEDQSGAAADPAE